MAIGRRQLRYRACRVIGLWLLGGREKKYQQPRYESRVLGYLSPWKYLIYLPSAADYLPFLWFSLICCFGDKLLLTSLIDFIYPAEA